MDLTMAVAATATTTTDLIGGLGGAFMLSREARAYSEETGFAGWTPYMRGRCGVLGEVDADVVASAVGFFPADVVRDAWEAGRSLPAEDAVRRYTTVCQEFGRRKLAGLAETDAERLAELLGAVAGNADVIGAPLAAGWRAVPLPDDARARVIQLAHVVRELRGGLHLVAVISLGLSPLEAILTGSSPLIPDTEGNARYFGWPEPYAEATDAVRGRRTDAEDLTDDLIAPAFGVLGEGEDEELTALLGRAFKVVFG
jgi:hypothetical protein